mmetsp:Transcript_3188/g.7432  ORF Transcript_3188/g.7432 Transcript_3188/m.7432 type:complete len:253 (-) Transcript_3188:294-1052(-)|eukprot:CAMPEP_0114524932 /NCGR_PEP_ID=MMETSP0109-20121206/22129_1 /TAXON_ID=29199 /ORGANISM="Chlorarachnion reptans, Strain CCCM449" /LENGTH=252 /DNA_ID=CAMNT_0001706429 /DNA_START=107 /DNA_END=865 /DNA_ORIENTATION=+
MSKSAFEGVVDEFFHYFDRDGDGFVTIDEARKVLKVALMGMKDSDEKIDSKKLESDVDRQVKLLLAKADFDHDKRISLEEFQKYYSNIVKQGMEPEVLLLDIGRAIKVLKAHNIEKSPSRKPKPSPVLESNGLCIVRTLKEDGQPGPTAGRLKLTMNFSLDGQPSVEISGVLKGLPASKMLQINCECKEYKSSIGKPFTTDAEGKATISLHGKLGAGLEMESLIGSKAIQLVGANTEKSARVGIIETIALHR